GDRAALEIDELRAVYGQTDDPARTAPIHLVVALRTVPGGDITLGPADPGEVAARLARSAAYERRHYFELLQRAGYVMPSRPAAAPDRAIAADRRRACRVARTRRPQDCPLAGGCRRPRGDAARGPNRDQWLAEVVRKIPGPGLRRRAAAVGRGGTARHRATARSRDRPRRWP